ncbi:hypothetical protein TCSYLVIO_001123, partial [Trypanosoma cruzi]
MIPRIQHRRKTLLVVTDSQSLLAALNKGPLSQTDWTEDQIWQRLLTLTCAGWSVHLQFCYGHCGVHANELADQHATQTMETGKYTEQGIAPLWHTDLLICFTTQLTNTWRSTIHQDTHRYLLCGTRPSDLSGKDLITPEVLRRQELVQLARPRCGESELWGRLYWAVRDCTNQCRLLMIPRIQHRRKTLLVVTDSQSLLAALNKGPLSQTDWTEDQIWQRLLTLACAGWSVRLQFCYGHCGVHANELADQHATQTMETGKYTEQGIAPLWHTDLLICFTTQLTNTWRSTIHQDTHRYLLCGTR